MKLINYYYYYLKNGIYQWSLNINDHYYWNVMFNEKNRSFEKEIKNL